MVSLNDALAVAENKRDNFGVPEEFKARFKVDINELKEHSIEIEKVCVVTRQAKDKAGEFIFTKNDEPVFNHVTFIAFGGDKYTVTKSALLAIQIDEIESVIRYEPAKVFVPQLEGAKVRIGFKAVRYADKKMYDQPYLIDA